MDLRNKKKTICFLTDILIVGGVENVLIEALKQLHEKYDITVLVLKEKPEEIMLKKIPDDVNVIYRPLPPSKLASKLYFSRLHFNKAFLKEKYDYCIALKNGLRYACFCDKSRYKIFWCHNSGDVKYAKKQSTLRDYKRKLHFKILYRKHDMVWTVTPDIANDLTKAFSLKNCYALPNPIDCDGILKKSEEVCTDTFDKDKINIVMLGRLSPEKGFERVVKVMAEDVFDKYKNVHLHIIGDGFSYKSIAEMIEMYAVNLRVTMHGEKANPYPYLKQADLLICPSKIESFGLVMLESMLLGVPVISTATRGGKYVTQNCKYATCVKNDINEIRNSVVDFLENGYKYSVKEAAEWAKLHDAKIFGRKIEEYLEVCEKGESPYRLLCNEYPKV